MKKIFGFLTSLFDISFVTQDHERNEKIIFFRKLPEKFQTNDIVSTVDHKHCINGIMFVKVIRLMTDTYALQA